MSYGYQKRAVDLLPGDISKAINMSRQHVYRAVATLIKNNFLCVTQKGYTSTKTYAIQKNYNKWKRNQKRFIEPKKVQSVTKKGSTPIKDNKDNNVVLEIIEHLNLKTGKNFKQKTPSTIKYISGRLRDGYTVEDMKSVIDTKTEEWKNDKKMAKYLCPSTLFSPTNFEKYINQSPNIEQEIELIRAPKDFMK